MFSALLSFFNKVGSWFSRKGPDAVPVPPQVIHRPYKEAAANIEYNSLFCDDKELLRPAGKLTGVWKEIFARRPVIEVLRSSAEDNNLDTRTRLLAYKVLRDRGVINNKTVLGVVIEAATGEGIDTLAVYTDLSVRYINSTGKIMISTQTRGAGIVEKVQAILTISQKIIPKAEMWQQSRPAPPLSGEFRITFLAADGVYVGDGKMAELDKDAVAKALIDQAGYIMVGVNRQNRVGSVPAAA
jgi:hypothetical protein